MLDFIKKSNVFSNDFSKNHCFNKCRSRDHPNKYVKKVCTKINI